MKLALVLALTCIVASANDFYRILPWENQNVNLPSPGFVTVNTTRTTLRVSWLYPHQNPRVFIVNLQAPYGGWLETVVAGDQRSCTVFYRYTGEPIKFHVAAANVADQSSWTVVTYR